MKTATIKKEAERKGSKTNRKNAKTSAIKRRNCEINKN